MPPRSFLTNLTGGQTVKPGAPLALRGIAFGGDCNVARVEISTDMGLTWRQAALGRDDGPYSFRQWTATAQTPASGAMTVSIRCTNTKGEAQPAVGNWNGAGFIRNRIENARLTVA